MQTDRSFIFFHLRSWSKTCACILLMLITGFFFKAVAGDLPSLKCYPVLLMETVTSTVLTSSSNPSCFGSAVALTATVMPNTVTGTIEYFDGVVSLGTAILSSGVAILNTSSLAVGSHSLTAVYSGNVNYFPSTSIVFSQVVNPAIPATPGSITGVTPVCPNATGLAFSIGSVINATSYTWVLPAGWVVNSGAGTTSITATSGIAGGNVTVAAVNNCGSSAASRIVNIKPLNATDQTGFTDGVTKSSDQLIVSTTTAPVRRGYLKFLLSAIPGGVTIVSSVLKITNNGTIGSSGSANQVRGLALNEPVGTTAATLFSAASTGTLYNNNTWSNIGQVSLTLLAAANTDISNSITTPGYIAMGLVRGAGANVYNFYGYGDAVNSPVLTVTYASIRSFAVTMNPATPATPGIISGPVSVCPGTTGNIYTILAVPNATVYTWTVPAGWDINSGQGTNAISCTGGSLGQNGNITVTAGNSCGTSTAQILPVVIGAAPTVSASPLTQTICSGAAIGTIVISNPNGIPGTTFSWTRNNIVNLAPGIAANGTGASITGTLVNNTGVQQTSQFTITANTGSCQSVTAAIVDVIVNPNPVANAGVDQSACAAFMVPIGGNPTASGGSPGYSYVWSAGVSDQAIANPVAPTGSYTVTVTDSKGCQGNDAVLVIVNTGTKTWIGGGTGGSGPDNNFNNPLNWSTVGVPGPCNDVIINVDVTSITDFFSGSLVINMTNDATVKSMNIHVGGTVIFSSTTIFRLEVGSNKLNIINNSIINTDAATVVSIPARSYISVGAGGVVTYGGSLTSVVSNGCTNFPIYASSNNNGKVYLNSHVTLSGIGNDPANKPRQVIFDGTGTQTITNNSGAQVIYLGATSTDIGEVNSPVVVLAGTGINGFRNIGDLNVNNTSTLDIGTTQTMNRNTVGGTINLAAGSFLKLGKNSGGVSTNNFPKNFSSYVFNASSTVDYNAPVGQGIVSTPLYGNLTLSNSGNKTAPGNINVQRNITIQNTAQFMGGVYTISLGGNWTNYGQTGFSEQTSLVDFNGTGMQTINTTGGENFYSLKKSAAGTTTMMSDVGVLGGGTSAFTLLAGTFDAGVNSFTSAASPLNMSGGFLKLGKTGAAALPEFLIPAYNITGGTIELYGNGDQLLRGGRDYRNLSFSTAGTKTVSSSITSINGTILTQHSVILDVSDRVMGGAGTNLTMTGTSTYRTAGAGIKPDATGTYSLANGTTVDFTNNTSSIEEVRLIIPTYYNMIITGSNVGNTSAMDGIRFQTGGSFTVKNNAIFKLANLPGFSGTVNTSIDNTNAPNIILEDGSVVEYDGGPSGTNAQQITNQMAYSGLSFSGSSNKTAAAGITTVMGNLKNAGSTLLHNNGTFLLNGNATQQVESTGTIMTFYDFIAANQLNVRINNDMEIAHQLSLGLNGKMEMGTGNVILKSDAFSTASVDKINSINSFTYNGTGRFIMERFIPTGATHDKTWQFLSVPANGALLNAAWQEGNAPLVIGTPGFGTTISSEKPGAIARGYDFYSPGGPSVKSYNVLSDSWVGIDDGVTATDSRIMSNNKGYMVFVRGDRSVQTSSSPANPTILRIAGKLYAPGTDAPSSSIVLADKLESIGNLYASAIDFTGLVSSSTGIDSKYYVWDPLLPGSSGLGFGGYQLLSSANLWMPVPGNTMNYVSGMPYSKIQSGQAFFVYSTPGGTVDFNETNKIVGNQMVYRHDPPAGRGFLRTLLFGESGMIVDGNVMAVDDEFATGFNADDAIKILNSGENFGIFNKERMLSLDARNKVDDGDTLFYSFNGLRTQTYHVNITPDNFESATLLAFFEDRYTHTSTPLSLTDSNFIDFAITADAASSSPDRFYIHFKSCPPVPVTWVSIKARRTNNKMVEVKWVVDNEINILKYETERSADGTRFTGIGSVLPMMNNTGGYTYEFNDTDPADAINFYRVKAIGMDGKVQYSALAKVPAISDPGTISIYPNPVKQKRLQIYFSDSKPGDYNMQLYNEAGQELYHGKIVVKSGHEKMSIPLRRSIPAGNYSLVISLEGKPVYSKQMIIE